MSLPDAPEPAIPGASRRMVEIAAPDVGRLRLHVSELGEGPPVLMLHGWPQHAGAWRRVAPLLAERHRLICPDLRGFGASDTPGRGYDSPTFADDAAALLDALGIERAFLVGHDWGGFSGFLLSLRHPERIRAFVACNTPLPWVDLSPRVVAQTWRAWYAVVLASPGLGAALVGRRPDLIAKLMSRGARGISDEDATAYARSLAEPERTRATVMLYRSYVRSLLQVTGGGSGGRGRLTVPTRLVFGADDVAISKELVLGDHGRRADDLQVELVEGCGHFTPEDRPELVAERALALFSGLH